MKKIFIRNISVDTKPSDLSVFFTPFLKRSIINPFRPKGKIVNQHIVAQKDREENIVRYHGLVIIESEKAGERILKRIRRTPFMGRKVIIREFMDRTWVNDRRNQQFQQKISPNNERRLIERRQHSLETVTHFQINFSHQPQFARKFG